LHAPRNHLNPFQARGHPAYWCILLQLTRKGIAMKIAICCVLLLLAGCTTSHVIEQRVNKIGSLTATNEYQAYPLVIDWNRPEAWEITDAEWEAWSNGWIATFESEIKRHSRKPVLFLHPDEPVQDGQGPLVTCTIYEMQRGGWGGVGGKTQVRAHVKIVDGDEVLYEARLIGHGLTGTSAESRVGNAVSDLALRIATIMERGG
jgi:hypothetical protein